MIEESEGFVIRLMNSSDADGVGLDCQSLDCKEEE